MKDIIYVDGHVSLGRSVFVLTTHALAYARRMLEKVPSSANYYFHCEAVVGVFERFLRPAHFHSWHFHDSSFPIQVWCNRPMLSAAHLHDTGLDQLAVQDASLREVLSRLVNQRSIATGKLIIDGTNILPSFILPSAAVAMTGVKQDWRYA